MAITALPSAAVAALPTSPGGPTGSPTDSLLLAGLPAEFAALLAQFTGNPSASTALPATTTALTPDELPIDKTESGDLTATSPADDLDSLILNAQPYLPPGLEKSLGQAVDRSKPAEDDKPVADGLLALAGTQPPAANTTPDERVLPPDDNPLAGLALAGAAIARHDAPAVPATTPLAGSTTGLLTGEGEALAGPTPAANIAADAVPASPAGASFATTLAAAQASPAAAQTPATTTNIPTPLHERQWGQEFGEKIVWLAKADHQVAQININPPQLGPVQINLNINGDQASAIFTSPHAEVRQAIEDAIPRLRDMLSAAGISLGQANVGAQLPQQNKEPPAQFANGARFSGETAILPGDGEANRGAVAIQRGRGLVDLFA